VRGIAWLLAFCLAAFAARAETFPLTDLSKQ
jgi:hypothetical protein